MKKKLGIGVIVAVALLFCVGIFAACGGHTDAGQPGNGHVHSGEWNVIKEATCTEEGSKYRICAECGQKEEEAIPKTDHDYAQNNICQNCGEELKTTAGLTYELYEEKEYPYKNCYAVTGMGLATDKNLVIPAYYMGIPVKKIAQSAFSGKDILTSIYIASGITEIEQEAFNYCLNVTQLNIPNSVRIIGQDAFFNCSKVKSCSLLGIESIGSAAFKACKQLSKIDLPDKGLTIGAGAFYDTAYYNQSRNWKDGMLYLGNHLLAAKDTTEKLIVPENVKSIAASAFFEHSKLKEIEIKGNPTVGSHAFTKTSVTKATVSSSVLNILPQEQIIDLTITSGYVKNLSGFKNVEKLIVQCELNQLAEGSLKGLAKLEDLTLDSLATAISSYSGNFSGFYTLGRLFGQEFYQGSVAVKQRRLIMERRSLSNYEYVLTYSNNIETYYISESLKKVTILNGVVPYYALENCTMLTEVNFGEDVKAMQGNIVYGCKNLRYWNYLGSFEKFLNITKYREVADIGYYNDSAQKEVYPVIKVDGKELKGKVTIPNGTEKLIGHALAGCKHITEVVIPDSVTSIADSVFWDCSALEKIAVSDKNSSFSSQDGILYNKEKTNFVFIPDALKGSITIPDGVTSIRERAFSGCSSLTSVTIPDGVTSIGNYAFSGCSSLTSVTIGNGVTSIGEDAFYNCFALEKIVMSDNNSNYSSQNGILYNKEKTNFVFIPHALKGHITIPDGVTSIGRNAFYDRSGLTSVTIGNVVTSIGESAFNNCRGLTSVTIPDGVTSIGKSAFYSCSSLTSVTIPDSVTSIGNYVFEGCSGLTSVTIGNGVASIGESAFKGCSSLTSVTIPDGVMSIGRTAFYDCSGLTSVTIGNGVTNIGEIAFAHCSGLTSVTIGNGVTSIGGHAFYNCSRLKSVTFSNKNGWQVIYYGKKIDISSDDLANPSTAAQYLLLYEDVWKRN